ncbi:hypothetical protein OWM54_13960 [Myxococcus sp. MISCRS1]|uniref:hypothetical protein n=1 Tax=unclassified Myxococcus TaxID=2648731 RepID=UPI001CBDA059|nr:MULTISPECIES: hypothetical protein [unclassified Myxococcus]MBZ4407845.1 hypothetical protein [Myxococcus sp. XM-1-1-1]MCY0998235.1 hypothetical protein [Myxococcus sp. MISCRS1]BDT31695.1 hypothetical protein MFMH1_13640 [Myxococcus sp. MH1]
MRRWLLTLSVLLTSCGLRLESLGSTVHVFAPEDAEAQGASIPVLYLEKDRALFFPEGVSGAAGAVEPRPSELVALGQRKDIVIIAVDTERTSGPWTPSGIPTRYVTHLGATAKP